jgi:hypothetical protein
MKLPIIGRIRGSRRSLKNRCHSARACGSPARVAVGGDNVVAVSKRAPGNRKTDRLLQHTPFRQVVFRVKSEGGQDGDAIPAQHLIHLIERLTPRGFRFSQLRTSKGWHSCSPSELTPYPLEEFAKPRRNVVWCSLILCRLTAPGKIRPPQFGGLSISCGLSKCF